MFPSTRRGFLLRTLGAAWTSGSLLEQSILRAAAARGQSKTAPSTLFTIEPMAKGVWGAVSKPATFINCNSVVFEMAEGLLVVDSHSKPSAAAALVAQIRREVSPKPVRFLVNSHFHWDHTLGNPAYRKAFPQMQVIASEATRRLLIGGSGAGLKSSIDNAAKSLDAAKKALSEAKTPEDKAKIQRVVADTESFLGEMKNYAPELPAITVKGDLILHDRDQELHVVFRGRAHTAGDVCVWSPSQRTLASGDMIHGSLPYMGDGYPADWPHTIAAVGLLEFERFLGGHAGVQNSRGRIYQMRDYLEELAVRVEQGKRAGKSIEQLQKEIAPPTMKSLTGGYPEGFSPDQLTRGLAGNVAQVFAAFDRPLPLD